jgi:hypothetical protein
MEPRRATERDPLRQMTNKSLGASDGSPVRRVTGCSYPPVDDERSSRGVGGIPGRGDGQRKGRTPAVAPPPAHDLG